MIRQRLVPVVRQWINHSGFNRNCRTPSLDQTCLHQHNYTLCTVRSRFYSSDTSSNFTEVPAVFDRIKKVASPSIVKKVNAIYVFDVEEEGKWHVDLTSGSGQIGQGQPEKKPDVTVTVNKENFLKMFNRELKPATAFMSGKLKLSGDLSKALALESVMKASRDDL